MLRVPGSHSSLERRRAQGAAVRVVYAPLDAVALARQEPGKHVVFFGVGFETTMPAIALAIRLAAEQRLENFSVLCVHKTMPAALRALLASGEVRVSGLLCPGHVTTIIGAEAYDFIPREFGIPCAVTGFEPLDMLLGIESILRQLHEGQARVDNVYTRAVQVQANPRAQALLAEVFAPADAEWRGLGLIPGSGVKIRAALRPLRRPPPVSRGLGASDPGRALALPLRRGAARRAAPQGSAPCSRSPAPRRSPSAPAWSPAKAPAPRPIGMMGELFEGGP